MLITRFFKKDLIMIKLVSHTAYVIQQFHFYSAIKQHYYNRPAMTIVVDRKLQEHSILVNKPTFFDQIATLVPDQPN